MKNTGKTDGTMMEERSYEGNLHKKIHSTVKGWPDWKKQEYNDNFAVSRFSEKLNIKKR